MVAVNPNITIRVTLTYFIFLKRVCVRFFFFKSSLTYERTNRFTLAVPLTHYSGNKLLSGLNRSHPVIILIILAVFYCNSQLSSHCDTFVTTHFPSLQRMFTGVFWYARIY